MENNSIARDTPAASDPVTKGAHVHYLQLVLVQLLWAGAFVAGELALSDQPPLTTAAVRYIWTSLLCAVLLSSFSPKGSHDLRPAVKPLVIMGFFGVFACNVLLYFGLERSTAVSAGLLVPTTQPIFTALLAAVLLGEPLSRRHAVGVAISIVGIAAVLSGAWMSNAVLEDLIGDLLMLGAALAFSIYSVYGKVALQHIGPLEAVSYSTLLGTAFLCPVMLLDGNPARIVSAGWVFWTSIGYLAIFATALPYFWWCRAISTLGAARSGYFTFLIPPFAVALAMIILKQEVTVLQVAGGLIVIVGIAVASGLATSTPPAASQRTASP